MGRHDRTVSLVLPVPDVDHLIEAELRAQPFADKIAWDIVPRRRGKLHATLCGAPVVLDQAARRALAGIGPIGVELRGLFSAPSITAGSTCASIRRSGPAGTRWRMSSACLAIARPVSISSACTISSTISMPARRRRSAI
jgi:hypothetical protein